ncbi:MAG: DUF547 domain-containing protein [Vibrio sp.]
MRLLWRVLGRFLGLLLLALLPFQVHSAPKPDLWPYWLQTDARSQKLIDHNEWQSIINTYLVPSGENNFFHYSAVTKEDKQKLKNYLHKVSLINPLTLNRDEQFAYWVNLYNALIVNLILDNYPIDSITNLGWLFSFGPWDQNLISINGIKLTLNDIEHRILRPIWKDKRIHYVLNCASLGCPNLLPQAFTASNKESLLIIAERNFIHSQKAVFIDDHKFQLSAIFSWYVEDFDSQEKGEKGVLEYLATFRPEIKNQKKMPSYYYNWALNDVK